LLAAAALFATTTTFAGNAMEELDHQSKAYLQIVYFNALPKDGITPACLSATAGERP
jgi:hypothetical protein